MKKYYKGCIWLNKKKRKRKKWVGHMLNYKRCGELQTEKIS